MGTLESPLLADERWHQHQKGTPEPESHEVEV